MFNEETEISIYINILIKQGGRYMKDYEEMEALLENLEKMQWDLRNIREAINAGDSLLSEIAYMNEVLRNFNNWCDEGWIEETIVELEEDEEIPAYMLEKVRLYDIDDTVHRVKNKFGKFKGELKEMSKDLTNGSESVWIGLEEDSEWVEQFKLEICSSKVQNMISRIMEIVNGLRFKLQELIDVEKQIRKDNNIIMSNLVNQEYVVI